MARREGRVGQGLVFILWVFFSYISFRVASKHGWFRCINRVLGCSIPGTLLFIMIYGLLLAGIKQLRSADASPTHSASSTVIQVPVAGASVGSSQSLSTPVKGSRSGTPLVITVVAGAIVGGLWTASLWVVHRLAAKDPLLDRGINGLGYLVTGFTFTIGFLYLCCLSLYGYGSDQQPTDNRSGVARTVALVDLPPTARDRGPYTASVPFLADHSEG